jgi:hypothetical protein
MKITDFDCFNNAQGVDQKSIQSPAATAKDFEIDFQNVPMTQTPINDQGLSGDTCTAVCKVTKYLCSFVFTCK